ncbi:hypothetical protein OSH11_09815 [Kaistia dalseonensis]|uniref:Dihydrofolate reductase n=1 Tax=Kaistia dalseonensis TaxID=410840 RepID=A0ABU0H5K7_9HYPH|nr:hypothetical protein [Kaistia dalseonensis]MCX5495001.1 hypothetical protein [Kaistia dalseonensis]MDQ0437582.1 hypothetical protein [Kaistia dalseonensis]
MSRYQIHGHAIISDNDCIAGEDGLTPESLRNEADWARFQAELDRAALVVVGRIGHEVNENTRGRPRMIVSSRANGIEKRDDGWWWNPGRASLGEALRLAAPQGGLIAVPGGRRVNDLFLSLGFDAFHLARKKGVTIPNGTPAFTRAWAAGSVERLLAGHGLHAGAPIDLDPAAGVTLTIWAR